MTLAEYTFQLDDGPVLNDDSAIPFVDVERVAGLDSAPYRETVRDHEGQDGGFMDAEFERGRSLVIEGTAFCDVDGVETYLDDLKENFAPQGSLIPFYLKPPGVDERVLFVKPLGVRYDWEQARRVGMTPIQFLMYAEDPRQYTNELQSISIAFGGAATTGFGFDFGFDLGFGVVVPPAGSFVEVGGNRPTPPTFTIMGPVINPRIINDTDSKSLDFVIELSATDTLVVDAATRTVVLNGGTNRRDTLQTMDWFFFNPGSTFITFGGGSGSGSLLIEYRDAWR